MRAKRVNQTNETTPIDLDKRVKRDAFPTV